MRANLTAVFKWVCPNATHVAVSFDLFGTLVAAERPADPATAVAAELRARDVPVPDDWGTIYRESHITVPAGAELSLPVHVRETLASRDVTISLGRARDAVLAAFDRSVSLRPGAATVLTAASEHGPVGLLSNCSVPGLVEQTLGATSVGVDAFDAVVTSVGCGWRKPDEWAFETVANALDVDVSDLVHVGDDPATDGGIADAGGTALLLTEMELSDVSTVLDRRERP